MKIWKLAALAAIGAGVVAIVRAQGEPTASMHEHDWEDGGVHLEGRRYRSVSQFLHHQRELSRMFGPIAQIYVLRAMDPAFREQVMIVTAQSNNCCT